MGYDIKSLKNKVYFRRLKLLDMNYKTSEIANELGVTDKYVRESLIRYGMPYTKDSSGHFWFSGLEVRKWIETEFSPENRHKPHALMGENEFYCVKCNACRVSNSYSIEINSRGVLYKKAYCPVCGTRMNKFIRGS